MEAIGGTSLQTRNAAAARATAKVSVAALRGRAAVFMTGLRGLGEPSLDSLYFEPRSLRGGFARQRHRYR